LQDIELLRNDEGWLNALGAQIIPDPTTAGDFLRRFTKPDICAFYGCQKHGPKESLANAAGNVFARGRH
jgi:hypothetical protein